MTEAELLDRTKQFAIRCMKVTTSLPSGRTSDVLARQLLRSATSVGANYRAACRARSTAEFAAKLGIVEEEADESSYWLELIRDAELLSPAKLQLLMDEANQLVKIVAASKLTVRRKALATQGPPSNRKSQIANRK